MPVEVNEKVLSLKGNVTIEEAERLFDLLEKNPDLKLDLSSCTHIHTSCLQILMSFKPEIVSMPEEKDLCFWIKEAMKKT